MDCPTHANVANNANATAMIMLAKEKYHLSTRLSLCLPLESVLSVLNFLLKNINLGHSAINYIINYCVRASPTFHKKIYLK